MPSFQDSAVLVVLALLLFGPKKLPVLARQLGKWMADFRRASNEFRAQMDEELRLSDEAERRKQIAALEASAPSALAPNYTQTIPVPEHPHLPPPLAAEPEFAGDRDPMLGFPSSIPDSPPEAIIPPPIAVSGDLSILPPATGLPVANRPAQSASHTADLEAETLHG